jgi:hypothetical protein
MLVSSNNPNAADGRKPLVLSSRLPPLTFAVSLLGSWSPELQAGR